MNTSSGTAAADNKSLPLVYRVFDELRKNKQEILLLDGGTGEELYENTLLVLRDGMKNHFCFSLLLIITQQQLTF